MRILHRVLRPGAVIALSVGISLTASAEPRRSLSGFRLDLRPQFEDVFPDSAELQRTLDRAAELAQSMRKVSDEFARAVQDALREVNALPGAPAEKKQCPAQVQASYARAQALGQEYLRIGREMARHHDQVRELDRLGDGAGLTPDYRARVQKVLRGYESLLGDYREMKATFHDQLGGELRFAGCDLGQKSGGPVPPQVAQAAPAQKAEARPKPTAPAQVASAAPEARGNILFYVDNSRCRRGHVVLLDGQLLGEVGGEARAGFRASAGPHDLCLLSQADPPGTRVATLAAPPPPSAPSSAGPPDGGARDAGAQAEGEPGEVPSPAVPSPTGQRCGDPGTVRRGYLHEGWTIALRCE